MFYTSRKRLLLAKLEGMSPEEQEAFWRQQNEALREWRALLQAQRQKAGNG